MTMSPTAERPQTIHLNGEPVASLAKTLEGFLIEMGYANKKVATAVNGDFVPERARAGLVLKAGDRIEILSARQGG